MFIVLIYLPIRSSMFNVFGKNLLCGGWCFTAVMSVVELQIIVNWFSLRETH